MKKYISILLVISVVLSLFAGCSKEDSQIETSGTETIEQVAKIVIQETTVPGDETTETTTPAPTEPERIETTAPTEATEVPTTISYDATEPSTQPDSSTATEEIEEKEVFVVTPPTTEPEETGTEYILNTNTKKFHFPWCSSVDQMKESNKKTFTGTRDEVIAKGYDPCGRCHP
ncbi:MAG: hypothetical protein ACI3V4_02430 [Faecousia sp.]